MYFMRYLNTGCMVWMDIMILNMWNAIIAVHTLTQGSVTACTLKRDNINSN